MTRGTGEGTLGKYHCISVLHHGAPSTVFSCDTPSAMTVHLKEHLEDATEIRRSAKRAMRRLEDESIHGA